MDKSRRMRRLLLAAAAMTLVATGGPAAAQQSLDLSAVPDAQPVALVISGWIPVTDLPDSQDARRQMLLSDARAAQEAVVQAIAANGDAASETRRYQYLPISALTTTARAARALLGSNATASIAIDGERHASLAESAGLVGAVQQWRGGHTGRGQLVAVIDTGVDAGHPFLAGKIAEEACFSIKCPNGQREMRGAGAARPVGIHGTHVAGIIAGKGDRFSGIAPEARIVAVNVFSRDGDDIGARDSDVLAGLDYVLGLVLERKLPIAAINMSLGGGRFPGPCANSPFETAAKALTVAGVAVVVASGNESFTDAIAEPACAPHVISVGAVDKSGKIAAFSNSSRSLTILAPGKAILSSVGAPGQRGFAALDGTSMATPHVAGAFAIMRQVMGDVPVADELAMLTRNAPKLVDPRNNVPAPMLLIPATIAAPPHRAVPPVPVAPPVAQQPAKPAPPVAQKPAPAPAPAKPAPTPVKAPVPKPAPPAPKPEEGWSAITGG